MEGHFSLKIFWILEYYYFRARVKGIMDDFSPTHNTF